MSGMNNLSKEAISETRRIKFLISCVVWDMNVTRTCEELLEGFNVIVRMMIP